MATPERVDGATGAILGEMTSGAQARIDAVRASLSDEGYSIIYAVLIYGRKPTSVTNHHHSVAQGIIISMLDTMAKAYGLKS